MILALVALWAFAESLLWFVVADVAISAVALRYGWKRALAAALVASVAAALGGLAMMGWANADPEGSRAAILALPGISSELFDQASSALHAEGFPAMLAGSFSGVPYKIYAHAAGVGGAGMAGLFLASVLARLPRFLLVGAVFGLAAPRLRRLLGKRLWAVFVVAWALFYAWYWWSMGW
jgi:hypothetical protein